MPITSPLPIIEPDPFLIRSGSFVSRSIAISSTLSQVMEIPLASPIQSGPQI